MTTKLLTVAQKAILGEIMIRMLRRAQYIRFQEGENDQFVMRSAVRLDPDQDKLVRAVRLDDAR